MDTETYLSEVGKSFLYPRLTVDVPLDQRNLL